MTGQACRHAAAVASSVFCASAVVFGSALKRVDAGAVQTSEFADFHSNRVRTSAAGVQISEAVGSRRLGESVQKAPAGVDKIYSQYHPPSG